MYPKAIKMESIYIEEPVRIALGGFSLTATDKTAESAKFAKSVSHNVGENLFPTLQKSHERAFKQQTIGGYRNYNSNT